MKRIAFIGQAPARPGSKHEVAGMYLRPWLYSIGWSEADITDYCRFYALMASFPGSDKGNHLKPSPQQILDHRPYLIEQFQDFQPELLVPVGAMAISELIPVANITLTTVIGNAYQVNPFDCLRESIPAIPLPHPSGRSTWVNQHQDLVKKALSLLASA